MHPVSDRAAEFIDSVADKPIICVSALHPNLYTLVCATRAARGHVTTALVVAHLVLYSALADCRRQSCSMPAFCECSCVL